MNFKRMTLALGVALAATSAQAKSVEDILKEKGVISEEEYKEAVKEKPSVKESYKIGDGFTFQSVDGNNKLTLSGRLQLQLENYTTDTVNSKASGRYDAQFRVRRAYFGAKGNVISKDLTYKLQLDGAGANTSLYSLGGTSTNSPTSVLVDAWLKYQFMDELAVEVGQDTVPFARAEINSSGALQFTDRSMVEQYFRPGYDPGLMVRGKFEKGLVAYDLGVFGGLGQNTIRKTANNAFAARVVVSPLGEMPYAEGDVEGTTKPQIALGGSIYHNQLNTGSDGTLSEPYYNSNYYTGFLKTAIAKNDCLHLWMWEADLAFRYQGLYLQAEYYKADAQAYWSGAERTAAGFYAQGGYFILPHELEVVARYGAYDPNTGTGVENDWVTETAGGLNYFLAKHAAKLQLEVASVHYDANSASYKKQSGGADDLRSRLLATVVF